MKNKLLKKIIELGADYALLNSCDEFSREHGGLTELAKITGFTGLSPREYKNSILSS